MTYTKLTSLFIALAALLYTGCSSTDSGAKSEPATTPPMAEIPDTEPDIDPEPEVEEIVAVEPDLPVEPEVVEPAEEIIEPAIVEPETLTILGFIKYVELEGGFFGIMTEDGTKYFPDYLGQDYKVDGLGVRVLAKPQEQILGIQMWGTPIEILKIEAN
jgi:hypothetical protein